MNLERLMQKDKMTPREMVRYMEISFQCAMGFRTPDPGDDSITHLNKQLNSDPLIAGYLMALTLLKSGGDQPMLIM